MRRARASFRQFVLAALLAAVGTLLIVSASAQAAHAQCGQVVAASITLDGDLLACPGDGLVVGAHGITIDLNGRSIVGAGLGAGIRNDGFDGVTIKNGAVQGFDYGVLLNPGTAQNVVDALTLTANQLAGAQLDGAVQSQVRSSTMQLQSNDGIVLVGGANGNFVLGNTVGQTANRGIVVQGSGGNVLDSNQVTTSSDVGISLEGSSGNRLTKNTVSANGDAGIGLLLGSNANLVLENTVALNQDAALLVAGSHENRIEQNSVTQNGDAGVVVTESNGSLILWNTISGSGDSGILLELSNSGLIRGNDVRFNAGGIEATSSNGNRIELNNASNTLGIGIELQDSLGNTVVLNTASSNGAQGIHVEAESELPGAANLIDCNTTNGNLSDGIVVRTPVHTIRANIANLNDGWGIVADLGNIDGGANQATGNSEPAQCYQVSCRPAPRECAASPPPPPPPPPPIPPQPPPPSQQASPPPARQAQVASQCRVPAVRGRMLRGARRAIVRAGCRVGAVRSRYARVRKGRVISQAPRAGRRVRLGSRVSLTLSRGARR
jgi:parallel beta-helix repeat protein